MLAATAAETAPRPGTQGNPVEPFNDAAGEGAGLGLLARQPAIELGHGYALVEKDLPILGPPTVIAPAIARQADALASDRERVAYFLQRMVAGHSEAEPHPNNAL